MAGGITRRESGKELRGFIANYINECRKELQNGS